MLNVPRQSACGLVDDLWAFALGSSDRTGRLSGLSAVDLATALDWPKRGAQKLVDALIKTEWMHYCDDGSFMVSGWQDIVHYQDDDNRERLRRMRSVPRDTIYERDGHRCVYCGSTDDLTLDHVMPISRGGGESPANLATCCRSCNSSKRARTPQEAGMQMLFGDAYLREVLMDG